MNDYDELCAWSFQNEGERFVHQHVVDAWMAQRADATTKPIGLVTALTGLCLHVDHGWSGRQVQRAHMKIASRKREWPRFELPAKRGALGPSEVLRADDRAKAISEWAVAVWQEYAPMNRMKVEALLREDGLL